MAAGGVVARRLAGILTALTVLSITSSRSLGPYDILGHALRYVGGVVFASSAVVGACVHRSLPPKHDAPEDVGELITEGPYSVVRHPFYLAMILMCLGSALYALSTAGAFLATASSLAWVLAAVLEEKELRRHWPIEYAKYSERVPMLIPRLRDVLEPANKCGSFESSGEPRVE